MPRLNTALPGRWRWYPAGTHAANALACACIYAAEAALDVRSGYWLTVVLGGVTSGFCGALSTVSTFVNEVSRRSQLPSVHHAWFYLQCTEQGRYPIQLFALMFVSP